MSLGASEVSVPKNVVKVPGVCGGMACLEGTRIPVWLLAVLWEAEASTHAVLEAFPQLCADDIKAAMAYADTHVDEIQRNINYEAEK